MKSDCDLIQERFNDYWDGLAEPSERLFIEEHLAVCPACSEEFRLWEESSKLIRDLQLGDALTVDIATAEEVNQNVMQRIYAEQSWFMPAVRRTYSFTGRFRLKVGGLLAAILTIFMGGLFYTVYNRIHGSGAPAGGVMETADAYESGNRLASNMFIDVPVASLSDPIVLHVNPVMPEYWIALSLLGVMMTLLILNWFTRVRA